MDQRSTDQRSGGWWRTRVRLYAAVMAAGLVLTVTGCGVPSLPQVAGESMLVHVVRSVGNPQDDIPPLDQTVTDPAKSEALYDALQALPPFPNGAILCPHETGVAYHLTFDFGQRQVFWAFVDAGGCGGVDLPHRDARMAFGQDHFWTVFADALGVPESALFPTPAPSGRAAP